MTGDDTVITLKPTNFLTFAALALSTMILFDCGGRAPDKRNPYGEMAKGLRDKGAHRKGTGFND